MKAIQRMKSLVLRLFSANSLLKNPQNLGNSMSFGWYLVSGRINLLEFEHNLMQRHDMIILNQQYSH